MALPREPGDARIAQTFVVEASGLQEIALYPAAQRLSGAGRAALTLTDVTPGREPRVAAQSLVDAARLASEQPLVFRFPPIAESRGRTFELVLELRGGPDAPAFLAVADSRYGEGVLRVDGRPEWGDLAFVARAAEDTPFRQLRSRLRAAGWPELPAAAWWGMMGIYHAACAVALWSLIAPAWRLARARSAE